MVDLHEASVENNDLLVILPVNNPVQIVALTEENKAHAIEQNSACAGAGKGKIKAKYSALRPNDGTDPSHLVVLASLPKYARHLTEAANMNGSRGVPASTRTRNMLKAVVPYPDAVQASQIQACRDVMMSFADLLRMKRQALDAQEKMRQAILTQIMEGRIGKDQAKEYIKQVMWPEYTSREDLTQAETENQPREPQKPKPGVP